MNHKLYDRLKFVAQVLLPALGTLYVALAAIWGLPNPEAVSGTVLAVDTALGSLLHLSSVSYKNRPDRYDGDLVVTEDQGGMKFSLELDHDPEEVVAKKDEILFKVQKPKRRRAAKK